MNRPNYILKASCTDTVGIVGAVTGFLADREALILEMSYFVDDEAQKSLIRVDFQDDAADVAELSAPFKDMVAKRIGMRFDFYPAKRKLRTLVAVSKQSHCLNTLLRRWSSGHLPVEITAVVSNHDEQRSLVERHGLPFHHSFLPGFKGARPHHRAFDP